MTKPKLTHQTVGNKIKSKITLVDIEWNGESLWQTWENSCQTVQKLNILSTQNVETIKTSMHEMTIRNQKETVNGHLWQTDKLWKILNKLTELKILNFSLRIKKCK